jgi:uncharacterized membrane protein YbaN (DUF454 family)
MDQFFWRLAAITALVLAMLGALLPGLPTTPFLLLAAGCGSRGWPAFERWLLAHPKAGPLISDWRDRGAVPRRAKLAALVMMVLSLLLLIGSGAAPVFVALLAVLMLVVGAWLWRRPHA